MSCGAKASGTLAEAASTLRMRSIESGWPEAAMAPMFQTTPRLASMLVVTT